MRIDPKVVVSPAQLENTKTRTASGSTPAPRAGAAGAAVVELSVAAKTVTPHATEASSSERLDKIRALLDAGEYAVDLDQLASRIVDDEVMRSRKPS